MPTASPGVAVASGLLGGGIEVGVAPRAAVFVIGRKLRPASGVVDENVASDAVEAEFQIGAGEDAALADRQYPETGHNVLLCNLVEFSVHCLGAPGRSGSSPGSCRARRPCASRGDERKLAGLDAGWLVLARSHHQPSHPLDDQVGRWNGISGEPCRGKSLAEQLVPG